MDPRWPETVGQATEADFSIVIAKTDAGSNGSRPSVGVFIVRLPNPSFQITRELPKMGVTAVPVVDITLEDCRVPAANLIGDARHGFKLTMQGLNVVRPIVAARSIGLAEGAIQYAVDYARERRTFGKPIIEHQAIGFRLAEMAMKIEAARLLAYRASWLVDSGRADVSIAPYLSMAKAYASEVAVEAADCALQTLGGRPPTPPAAPGSGPRASHARGRPHGPVPPVATTAATRSGTRSAASGRIVSHSPSTVSGPNVAMAARPASSRPVTRRRTPSAATTSSSVPEAITRPWWRITIRSQTRSTSVRRCELRMTVAPRSRAARTIARTSIRPTGSSADVGSSSRISSGSPSSATARPETLLHPLREAADRVVGAIGQTDMFERIADASADGRRRDSGEFGVEGEHLAGVEPRLVAEELGQVADPCPGRAIAERGAEHASGPRGRPGEPEQELDRGRLARAVRSEEADQLAATDAQVEPVERGRPAERLDDAVELDRGR